MHGLNIAWSEHWEDARGVSTGEIPLTAWEVGGGACPRLCIVWEVHCIHGFKSRHSLWLSCKKSSRLLNKKPSKLCCSLQILCACNSCTDTHPRWTGDRLAPKRPVWVWCRRIPPPLSRCWSVSSWRGQLFVTCQRPYPCACAQIATILLFQ